MEKFVSTTRGYGTKLLFTGRVIKTIIEYSINGESPPLVFLTYSISESCRDQLSSGITVRKNDTRWKNRFFLAKEKHPDDSRDQVLSRNIRDDGINPSENVYYDN